MSAWHLLAGVLQIVVIDLLLAGDNALVIAVAVRSLPKRQRRAASACGAGAAVALRVVLTAVAARMLSVPYLQLAGGLLILWISLKVLLDASARPEAAPAVAGRLLEAIWYILAADITMSTDNILAIAGASRGNIYLIVFGLSLSIPLVVFAANLLATLMDRYPALIYVGSAILGKVGAEMILTDTWVARVAPTTTWQRYSVEAAAALGVVIVGRVICRARARRGRVRGTQGI
jgi:YjbE family integral membrane protein